MGVTAERAGAAIESSPARLDRADETVIRTERLTKYYRAVPGIIDVDLAVRRGEVFGFLGPNGAGKTTTIRLLLDLIRPTSGRVELLGLDGRWDAVAIHRRVGYVPGELALYDDLTGEELIRFSASLRGGVDWAHVRALAERFHCDLGQRVRELSHGNRQKVALLRALAHRPELLILDEPTQGLDPLMQHEFYEVLDEVRAGGGTVFLSSHFLPEIERVCHRVGMIRAGRLFAIETVDALRERLPHRLEVRFDAAVPREAFAGLPGVRDVTVEGPLLRCAVLTTPDAVIKAAARFTVVDVVSHEPSLEDVFLALYEGEDGRVG